METRVALIGIIVENEASVAVRALHHRADGRALPTPGCEHHLRGAGRASGRYLRSQRQAGAAGGRQCQDTVFQHYHKGELTS